MSNAIDLVIPYVTNSDPEWKKIFDEYNRKENGTKIDVESNGNRRFSADDILFKYVIRGIAKNLPFINKLHLLVMQDSQVPKWINRDNVHIVYHKDFIPSEYLPLFNSSAIEMFLKNIPDLSEHFIYTNDDFWFNQPLKESDFFTANGTPLTEWYVNKVKTDAHQPTWYYTFLNADRTVSKDLKSTVYYQPSHRPASFKKSILEEVYNKYEKEIKDSITRFRKNNNINQYIYTDYMIRNNLCCKKSIKYSMYNSQTHIQRIIRFFTESTVPIMVWNSTDENDEKVNNDLMLHLMIKFPKCKYEN